MSEPVIRLYLLREAERLIMKNRMTKLRAAAEGISHILIVLAFILLIYTVIKLGYVSFITISAKKYKEKKL